MTLAQIFCERLVRDLESNLTDLAKYRRDPQMARYLEAETVNLHSALTLLQLICSALAAEQGARHERDDLGQQFLDGAPD